MKKFYQLFLILLLVSLVKLSTAAVTDVVIVVERNTCPGICDGKAYFTSFTTTPGSTGPYIFNWIAPPTPTQTGDTAFNLCSGSHVLQVLDLSDPTPANTAYSEPFIVPLIGALFVNPFITPETCFNSCDGSITALPGGGTTAMSGVYSYQWDHMNSTSQTISNLCQGNYSVTVTDDNGCTTSSIFMLGGPTQIQPMVTATDIDCDGNGNGSGVAAPSGGVPPYTYSWSSTPGNNSTTESGLSQGTFTVTVTDNDGCTGIESFTINEPQPLMVMVSSSDVACFGEMTGGANATVSGGTVPYTYDWGSGNTSDDFVSGLAANSYILTVTDGNNCMQTSPFTVFSRPEIVLSLDSTDVDCNGNSTGAVMHVISGGTPPYNWAWSSGVSNSGNSGQSNGLAAGTYTITVTDVLNCEKIDSIVVNQPAVLQASVDGIIDPSCVGGMDGEIDISITGGTPPYTTLWNDLSTDIDRTGLAAGSYTVQITDDNGCQVSADTVLVNPAPILPNVDTTDVSCRGGSDGTATTVPTGGSGVYTTFRWSSNLTNNTPTETGLAAGTYTVTITDSDGCTGSETFVVNEPATLFTVSTSKVDADCFGNSTGSVTAIVNGGDPVYSFLWDNVPPSTTATVNNLPAGTYNVTATDGNGCQQLANVTVDEPNPILIDLDSTDVGCNSESTGSIDINISGGSPVYNWTLTGGSSGTGNQTVTGLAAGLYRITVTDANTCSAIDSIVINEPPALAIMVTRELNPLCTGDLNGEIDITVSGGTIPYTFEWNDMSPVQNRTGLAANTYTVTVTDNEGCTITATSTLTDPPMLTATIDSLEDASCNGFSDGFLRVLASGGTGMYTYAWSGPGPNTRENPNLAAGTYTVTVIDNNGCQITKDTTIVEPIALIASATAMDASCSGAPDGTATASEVGGSAPFSYNWSTTPPQTNQTATGLIADTYTVTVTDANGCTDTESVMVGEPITITLNTTQTNVDCNGAATGDATVIPMGGTAPLSFEWSTVPPQLTATATGLIADTYTVTVTDNNGCNTNATVTITEPIAVNATITSFINPTCDGINDGTITAGGTGGTVAAGYTYEWSTVPVQNTQTISLLAAGTYTVTVSDDNSCTDVTSITLINPPSVIVTQSINDANCFGENSGNIKLTTTGGTAPYTYNWDPVSTMTNASGDSAFNLLAGSYMVTVTDNNGCQVVRDTTISEPGALVAGATATDASCFGALDGTATASETGGNAPYSYAWSTTPTQTNQTATGLAANTYNVTVTDANGCTDTESVVVGEPTAITLIITQNNADCNGAATGDATVITAGGTPPLSFEWSTTPPQFTSTATNLIADTYTVTITDNNSCITTTTVTITEPTAVTATITTSMDPTCNGIDDGSVTADGNGGTITLVGYSYVWSTTPPQTTQTISNLGAGTYTVTVSDDNGCTDVTSTTLTAPPSVIVTESINNVACNGDNTGNIKLTTNGGTPPYTYNWNPITTTTNTLGDSAFDLLAGTYTATVLDNNGCFIITPYTVTEPSTGLVATFDTTDVSCNGLSDGNAKITVTGGTIPYIYNWEGSPSGNPSDSIFNLIAGTYRVTVTDNGGCTMVDSTVINEPNVISITIDTTINVACSGDATGGATVTANGGNGSFNYVWSFMSTPGQTIANLTAGTYTVTATDGNSCTTTLDVPISEPDTLKATLRTQDVSCGSTSNAYAVVDVTGGIGTYTYMWTPMGVNGQGTDSIFDLAVGNYSLTVLDSNNCDSIINFSIAGAIANFTYRDSLVNDSCGGACNGYIEVLDLAGGNAPYSFEWSRAMEITPSLSNVCAGTYTVTITDNNGCDSIAIFTITEPDAITATISTIPDTCISGVGSASINGLVIGGVAPLTFDWGNGPTSDDFVNNLSATNYNLTISDANLCSSIIPFTIGNVAPFSISFITSDVSCNGLIDGSVQVSTVGATNPVTYNWEDGLTGGANPPPVGAGDYEITVTDANGCAAIDTARVSQPDPIGTTITTISESCFPGMDGSATAISTGGVAPLTYDWGSGPTLDAFSNNRTSGFFRLTITDANNCQETESYTIGVTPPFTLAISTTDASCNGGSDGIIDVMVTGGTTPFTFDWPVGSGLVGQMPTNASRGSYRVTVTDATSCSVVTRADVGEANPIEVMVDTLQDESCSPGMDGFAKISVSGGADPYTFDWDPTILPGNISIDRDSVFNLANGPYTVTITDGTGCTRISSIFINQGSDIIVASTVTEPLCFGDMNGSISIAVTGGTPPYIFEWFDMSNGTMVSGLGAGAYAVTITDDATPPCTKVELIRVDQPDPIVITSFGTILESCNPGMDGMATISANGGTNLLSYSFSQGSVGSMPNIVQGLSVGTYTVTVSDANNCQLPASFTIQAAQNFNLDIDSIDATCGGGNDGELFTTINGGVNPYSYNWDGGVLSGADPKNLTANTYTLTVTDAFGCTATGEGIINEPLAIMATFSITDESCFPGIDGAIVATPINGQGDYTYDWGNGFTPDNFANNLTAGNFNVTVTDDSMCIAILPYTIGSSAPFTLTDSLVNIDCAGNATGEIYLTSTNLAGPIPETYQWSSNVGANTMAQNQLGLLAGTYSVTVTDPNNGCFETEIFTITEPDTLKTSGIVTNAGCQPVADDGAVDLSVTGGTPPFTYMWSNGFMTQDISDLLMGSYTVTVIDSNSCQTSETFVVSNLSQVMVDLDSIDVSCSGATDGSAIANASGGVMPYTYAWSNMGTTATISSLVGGKYTVTITDNAACSIIDSIVVNESIIITNALTLTGENCVPSNDGTASAMTSGGTPPYTYDWGNGNVLNSTEIGLTANTYTVTITDLAGCFITDTFTINSVAPFNVSSMSSNNVCAGDSAGTINITVSDNVGPPSFAWPSPLPSIKDQINLPAGTYTVTITDMANGCTETVPFTITEPDSIKPMATITPENCNLGGNGSVIIAPIGGDGSYTFNWSGLSVIDATLQNQTNLSAGKYFLTITDGNACISVDSFAVPFIISTIPNLTVVNDGCNALGVCLGSAKVAPTGGVMPYTYNWVGPSGPIASTMDSIGSLCTGSYMLTIIDDSGCDTTINFDIQSGRTVFPNELIVDESCNIDDDGQISVTPTGGEGPYIYEWSGSPITDSLRTGLSPGTYTVTITDISNCDTSITVTVGTEQFDYSVNSTDITCGGTCDGTAGVSLAGGNTGFTFDWNTTDNTQTLSNLCDGKYYVTITNTANGCAKVDSVTINPTTIIVPNESFTNETCNSFCDGTIDLAPTGGAGGYSYAWSASTPPLSGPNVTGLCGGTYTVTISDVSGCSTSLAFNIQSSPLILATVTEQDLSCGNSGSCDGRAFVTASNGVPPYAYNWPTGVSTVIGAPDTAINLCAGTYTVTISDAGSCSITETFVIGGPSPIAASFMIDNSTCNIPNGELSVTASGGSGSYSYEWFDAMLNSLGTGTSITGLESGAYSIVITDGAGCSESFNASVNDDGAESIMISNSTDVNCFGDSTGSATVSFTCTDPACSVAWFNSVTGDSLPTNSNTVNGLAEGVYFVRVTNGSGCIATEFVTIGQPTEVQVSSSITDNVCGGDFNGAISLSVSGGVGPFSFNWSPAPGSGQNSNSVSGLSARTYSVTVTDDNSCDTVLSYTIGEPLLLSTTFTTSEANCNMADGTINAVVAGGTIATDYEYQWFDDSNVLLMGETNPILSNVSAGGYALRVRDDNVCQKIFNVTLNNVNGPTVVVDLTQDAGCFGESNGEISTTASGGTIPYTYNWSPTGQTTNNIVGLTEGTYTLQVTDALGCITSTMSSVTNSTELMANISIQEATCGICNGTATVSVTGGTAPYNYLWSNASTTDSADSLCGGNYTVVVTDAAGCSKAFDFGVNTIGGPTGETVSVTPASCANSNDGTATVVPVGGTPPYTYLWQHNGLNTNTLNNLGIGKYFLQVADARSCSRTVEIDITGPSPIVVVPQIVGSTCNASDGSILLNVSGGSAPYTYNWATNPQDTNFLDNLPANIYNVNVSDANGCVESLTITLSNTGGPLTVQPTVNDVSCFGSCDGLLYSGITGGIGTIVNFQWLDDQNNVIEPVNVDSIFVCAGTYVLELTSLPLQCKSYVTVVVDQPDSITLSSSVVKNISCFGSCDGEIFINTRGGTLLYSYSWSDPSIPDAIPAFGLCAGTYTVEAKDTNGCSAITSVTLENPPQLVVDIQSNTNLVCSSDENATATSVGSGGTLPYTFTWSEGQTGPNPTDLGFGENILTLTDSNNCVAFDTIMISSVDTVITESFGNPVVCDEDSIRLNGQITGNSITSFGWYLSDGTNLNFVTSTLDTTFLAPVGEYLYLLIAESGTCSDTARFEATVFENPIVGLPLLVDLFNDEVSTIELANDKPSYTYVWSPSDGLSDSSMAEPVTSIRENITYTLLVTDTNGCVYLDSVPVTYSPNIEIPTGITPNGDGVNDVWNIEYLDEFPKASVQIFNRWGTLLFESTNGYTNPWDGTYKGSALPIGTYYYIIDLKTPKVSPLTGPITIVR